ncbi:MAG: hypothetical protein JWO04_3002 [Gammaproteobacteria bacterium]|nr:hypothetical protein [Gammaproteobacteria bacterium]
MSRLTDLIPDVHVLTALTPEELAGYLLSIARDEAIQNNGQFLPGRLTDQNYGSYGREHDGSVRHALDEAWHWLDTSSLIMPAHDINGKNSWRVLTRQGHRVLAEGTFASFRRAEAFALRMM